MIEELYQITSSYYCAGIIIRNNIICKAAPILGWTLGKDIEWFKTYCASKSFIINKIL